MRMRSVAVTLGALFLAFSTLPASAHTVLVTSSPQANSVIESIPSSISITFAEDLVEIGNSNSISVLDEDGEEDDLKVTQNEEEDPEDDSFDQEE